MAKGKATPATKSQQPPTATSSLGKRTRSNSANHTDAPVTQRTLRSSSRAASTEIADTKPPVKPRGHRAAKASEDAVVERPPPLRTGRQTRSTRSTSAELLPPLFGAPDPPSASRGRAKKAKIEQPRQPETIVEVPEPPTPVPEITSTSPKQVRSASPIRAPSAVGFNHASGFGHQPFNGLRSPPGTATVKVADAVIDLEAESSGENREAASASEAGSPSTSEKERVARDAMPGTEGSDSEEITYSPPDSEASSPYASEEERPAPNAMTDPDGESSDKTPEDTSASESGAPSSSGDELLGLDALIDSDDDSSSESDEGAPASGAVSPSPSEIGRFAGDAIADPATETNIENNHDRGGSDDIDPSRVELSIEGDPFPTSPHVSSPPVYNRKTTSSLSMNDDNKTTYDHDDEPDMNKGPSDFSELFNSLDRDEIISSTPSRPLEFWVTPIEFNFYSEQRKWAEFERLQQQFVMLQAKLADQTSDLLNTKSTYRKLYRETVHLVSKPGKEASLRAHGFKQRVAELRVRDQKEEDRAELLEAANGKRRLDDDSEDEELLRSKRMRLSPPPEFVAHEDDKVSDVDITEGDLSDEGEDAAMQESFIPLRRNPYELRRDIDRTNAKVNGKSTRASLETPRRNRLSGSGDASAVTPSSTGGRASANGSSCSSVDAEERSQSEPVSPAPQSEQISPASQTPHPPERPVAPTPSKWGRGIIGGLWHRVASPFKSQNHTPEQRENDQSTIVDHEDTFMSGANGHDEGEKMKESSYSTPPLPPNSITLSPAQVQQNGDSPSQRNTHMNGANGHGEAETGMQPSDSTPPRPANSITLSPAQTQQFRDSLSQQPVRTPKAAPVRQTGLRHRNGLYAIPVPRALRIIPRRLKTYARMNVAVQERLAVIGNLPNSADRKIEMESLQPQIDRVKKQRAEIDAWEVNKLVRAYAMQINQEIENYAPGSKRKLTSYPKIPAYFVDSAEAKAVFQGGAETTLNLLSEGAVFVEFDPATVDIILRDSSELNLKDAQEAQESVKELVEERVLEMQNKRRKLGDDAAESNLDKSVGKQHANTPTSRQPGFRSSLDRDAVFWSPSRGSVTDTANNVFKDSNKDKSPVKDSPKNSGASPNGDIGATFTVPDFSDDESSDFDITENTGRLIPPSNNTAEIPETQDLSNLSDVSPYNPLKAARDDLRKQDATVPSPPRLGEDATNGKQPAKTAAEASQPWTQPPPPRPTPAHATLPPSQNVPTTTASKKTAAESSLEKKRSEAMKFAPKNPSSLRASSRLSTSTVASEDDLVSYETPAYPTLAGPVTLAGPLALAGVSLAGLGDLAGTVTRAEWQSGDAAVDSVVGFETRQLAMSDSAKIFEEQFSRWSLDGRNHFEEQYSHWSSVEGSIA